MDERVLLRNVGVPDSHEINVYIERGGYQSLPKTLKEYKPEDLVVATWDNAAFCPKKSTPAI